MIQSHFNRGQDHPNGCCTAAAYKWCKEKGYILNDCFCLHPDRHEKKCSEIHGDDEIEELLLKEMNETTCGV